MKVSIVIPIFNCEKYLKTAIPALLSQTYKDFEIILVDDGSTDNSLGLCNKFARENDKIAVIHKDKSEGAGPARNTGIHAASGEYIIFLDADDRYAPTLVEKLVVAISLGDYDVAVCGYQTYVEGAEDILIDTFVPENKVYTHKAAVREFFANLFPEGMAGYLWNKIYKTSVIRENHIEFPAMRRLQDGAFNIRYFDCAESCVVIDEPLYFYRLNAQTDTFKKCPPDYFDLVKQLSTDFIDKKSLWGNYPDDNVYKFFLNEVGTCLENAYSKQWGFKASDRAHYFYKLRTDELFLIAKNQTHLVGIYRKILIKLLEARKNFLLGLVIRSKIALKLVVKWVKSL